MNSRAEAVRGLCGPRTAVYDARAGFLQILVVSVPLRVHKGALRVPHGPRAGLVGYEKHWIFPCGARMMPVRASHGVHVESSELFHQTFKCTAVSSGMGPVA